MHDGTCMGIIDTSLLIERVSEENIVNENICLITLIEYPMVLEYKGFRGKIYSPDEADLRLALELQEKLRKVGRMKNASDLIIAAVCLNNNEELLTLDSDFGDIAKVSNLKLAKA